MDLSPFSHINPCGYAGLEVTQLKDLGIDEGIDEVAKGLLYCLQQSLGYSNILKARNVSDIKELQVIHVS